MNLLTHSPIGLHLTDRDSVNCNTQVNYPIVEWKCHSASQIQIAARQRIILCR
jgi:hypothetical protein